MQEGCVGLLRALVRYDPQRGVPFPAYATWWVRQALQAAAEGAAPAGRAEGRARPRLRAESGSESSSQNVNARFGFDRPPERLAQVGRRLGISAERARQIEERALVKLRHGG